MPPPSKYFPPCYTIPEVVAEQHPTFSDLKQRLEVPKRVGKAGWTTLWLVDQHPLVPADAHVQGRHFVLLWPGGTSYLKRIFNRLKNSKPPAEGIDVHQLGWVLLAHGDYVFIRDLDVEPADPMQDTLFGNVVDCCLILPPDLLQSMQGAQQMVLGPRAERTRDRPDPQNPVGGTQLERVVKPVCVKGSPRAFQMCATDQAQTKCNSPVAWGKIPDRSEPIAASVSELPASFKMRHEIVNVSARVAMAVFHTLPKEDRDAVSTQMSTVNAPRIAAHENTAFTAVQINIAAADLLTPAEDDPPVVGRNTRRNTSASPQGQSAHSELQAQLGDFGGFHVDNKDSVGTFTIMVWCSDLPDSYLAGMMYFPELGLGAYLAGLGAVNFCGQHMHGGTSPKPMSRDAEQKDYPYRLTLIHYTHAMPIDGDAIMPLIPLPHRKSSDAASGGHSSEPSTRSSPLLGLFTLRPEYQLRFNTRPSISPVQPTSYMQDGMPIMEPRSIFMFAVRTAVMFLVWCMAQLPPEWDVRVDVPAILNAVTMQHGEGRMDAGDWPEAPSMEQFTDSPSYDEDQSVKRPEAFQSWSARCDRRSKHIPRIHSSAPSTGESLAEARDEHEQHEQDDMYDIDEEQGNLASQAPVRGEEGDQEDEEDKEDKDEEAEDEEAEDEDAEEGDGQGQGEKEEDEQEGTSDVEFCKYLGVLTPTMLCNTLNRVLNIYDFGLQPSPGLTPQQKTSFVDMARILQEHTYTHDAACQLPLAWSFMPVLLKESGRAELLTMALRHEYLLMYAHAFTWLEGFVDVALNGRQADSSEWYCSLAFDVYTHIKTKKTLVTYDPKDYLQPEHLERFPNAVAQTVSFKKTVLPEPQVLALAWEHLMQICASWLGFPTESASYAKAYFLSLLCRYGSHALLYLPQTYTAFRYINQHVLGKARYKPYSQSAFKPFLKQLKVHPLLEEDSIMLKNLANLEGVFNSVDTSPFCPPVPRPDGIRNTSLKLFADFILCLLPLIDNLDGKEPQHALQRKVFNRPDFYLPFREHAPSLRIACEASVGPYSSSEVETRAGAFSSILFRALTFSTPIVTQDQQVWFADLVDWKAFLEDHKAMPDSYFANKGAYGQPNKHRTPAIADDIWRGTVAWVPFLKAHEGRQIPPLTMFNFIRFKRNKKNQQVTRFPNVGNLTAYLLTADYVAAGLVTPPTAAEMAKLICAIGAGAIGGLEKLHLLPSAARSHTPDNVEWALRTVMNFMRSALITEEQDLARLDFIMLEHALCKFKRLNVTEEDVMGWETE
ncbi:hypothetical protein PsYK624_138230 [Phanerochaete sordida]|uniref:Uncharacterized protein n=1 Tax=Phanerochaete sordida TaxID=48140 RepID=A0A9P3LKU2_9APHY|nr:hypothetical protein PsYK624_138230 [Phanerochaete sordida]